jgi:hypothetical protein
MIETLMEMYLPFNIAHRHPFTRDFFREGASDLVDGMRSPSTLC